jgi:alpha-L-rhamnosidase
VISDAPTAYALVLSFALLPDAEQRQYAGTRLAALVRDNEYRISTGFVGTPLLCDALCSAGEEHVAFRLLTERTCPSWLYPVTMGATTIWERWDSMLPDGTINPGEMTSFNHYALGAVADWLHRTVGGLTPAAPGYRRLSIQPRPGGGISRARVRHSTPYGMAECSWEIEAGQMTVDVVIPPNTTAHVMLPGDQTERIEVKAGTHRWSVPYQERHPQRLQFSLDSTLGEIRDDPEVWMVIRAMIAQHMPELVEQIEAGNGISGTSDLMLRHMLFMRPDTSTLQADLETVLAGIGSAGAPEQDAGPS